MSEPICQTCYGTGLVPSFPGTDQKEVCDDCPCCEWCGVPAPEFEPLSLTPGAVVCLQCWQNAGEREQAYCEDCGRPLYNTQPHPKPGVCRPCGMADYMADCYEDRRYGA